jgi:tRNA(fMet)-specific endonuclease VapC
MTALDTDVLTLFLRGNEPIMSRIFSLPWDSLALPIVVAEEVFRGRLDAIRKAQSHKKSVELIGKYHLFHLSIQSCSSFKLLPYSVDADRQYESWRARKIRVGIQDLRIAAICVAHGVPLATRNRRDFRQLDELTVHYWG